jgi:hypothetical protein
MKYLPLLVLVLCCGCSTAPLAGTLDTLLPSRPRIIPEREREELPPRGLDSRGPVDVFGINERVYHTTR